MRLGLLQRTFLLSSLILGGAALAYGCTLDSEGQGSPDASIGGSGGTGIGGTGGTTSEAGPDQDTPDIGSPDVPCFYPNKICDGVCVDFDDPLYGCAQETCEPCDSRPHSKLGCVNNECLVVGCEDGWDNCDGDPLNGCETDIWDVANCGKCGEPCALPHATAQCNKGVCEIFSCDDPYDDCNNNAQDGCETPLTTNEDCGECFETCTVSDGEPTCASGVCKVNTCPAGRADCDSDPTTCETDITTTSDCGGCGLACTGPNVGSWTCGVIGGARACLVGSCNSGWGNCDDNDNNPQTQANGCEVNLQSAVNHCGQCAAACAGIETQSRACATGLCVPTCNSGFADCDGPEPGVSDDGCETSVSTDVNNCGSCGNVCNLAHANESCQSGNCNIASCASGWGNCDSNVPNGCETSLHTLTNCGSCGTPCNIPNSGEQCDTGVCTATTCTSGYGDCTSAAGCETPLNTLTDCGGCGITCDLPHASESCSTGTCQLVSCEANWGDCTGSPGCETDLRTLANCGGCGTTCNFAHAAESCATGSCVMGACETNYGDCNTNTSDGCETALTSTTNCGGCGVACNFVNASETCATGTCVFSSCQAGYADCSGDAGCETNIADDVDNCGACSAPCANTNVQTRDCVSSQCAPVCASGWEDCDGPESGVSDDGCETDTETSVLHCGACGQSCNVNPEPPNASWQCQTGLCEPTCDGSWFDCDDVDANGCECPNQFACTGGLECKCDADTDCGQAGEAACNNGTGLCTCTSGSGTDTTCVVGQVCDGSGGCK